MGGTLLFEDGDRDLRRGASAEQRVLAAIHRRFRRMGGAPSWGELQLDTGIRVKHMGRVLRALQARGDVALQPGRARGITLVRRGAMLSDVELELEAAARGATINWPTAAAALLISAYPVDTRVADCGGDLVDLLGQIDAAIEERDHGAGEAAEGQGGDTRADRGAAPAHDR